MASGEVGKWSRRLDADGFCIIPKLASRRTIEGLKRELDPVLSETEFCSGDFYGYRTKRVGGLPRRTKFAHDLVLDDLILKLARAVLDPACDRIQLNVAQLIEIHPGEITQFPHRDDDMWPIEKRGTEYLLNVIWPLDTFTSHNGATRIYPGSHRMKLESIDDLGEPVILECEPGSAICFLGSTVHGAGANRTLNPRRAIVIGYSLGWLRPHENPSLAYPPSVAKSFPSQLAELVGYIQHRPNLGNYEGHCPSLLLSNDAPFGATDALRPDQAEAVREFARQQKPG
jgi:ectoine hydroxylase-related dioxygenase (phytanoyl-CoA dioxygenase family)